VTAEFIDPKYGTTMRFTPEAQYFTVPSGAWEGSGLAGKRWGTRRYEQLGDSPEPAEAKALWRSRILLAGPAPYLAMLSQAPDLRLVGPEPVAGAVARHYTGTVNLATITAAEELGLPESLPRRLRRTVDLSKPAALRLDAWLGPDGYPVRVRYQRTGDPPPKQIDILFSVSAPEPHPIMPDVGDDPFATMTYSGYGKSGPVAAPPPPDVHQLGRLPGGPEFAVLLYLHYLGEHNPAKARQFLSPDYAARVEQLSDSPLHNVVSIGDVQVSPVQRRVGDAPGVWYVPASFTLAQRTEVSRRNGVQHLGYLLVEDPATGDWRIIGEGA
jgi:hypothetical protein